MFNSFKNEHETTSHGSKAGEATSSYSVSHDPKPAQAQSHSPASSSSKSNTPNHSIVDENLTMKGDLESDGDIMVKGKVIGNITCNLLIIDRDALVEGGINATEVIVRGKVKGKVDAERVRLERTADVECDIVQKSFSAEEGARIKGSLCFKTEGGSVASSKVTGLGSAKATTGKPDSDEKAA